MGYYAGQSDGRDWRPHGDYDFSNLRPKQPLGHPVLSVDSKIAEIIKTGSNIEALRDEAHNLSEAQNDA